MEMIEVTMEDLTTVQKLEKLPKLIYEQELKVNALSTKIDLLKARIEALKLILKGNISLEVNEENKPKYKNEDSREAELSNQLNQSVEYLDYKKEFETKTFDTSIEQIKLKYLNNLFNSARSLARVSQKED